MRFSDFFGYWLSARRVVLYGQ